MLNSNWLCEYPVEIQYGLIFPTPSNVVPNFLLHSMQRETPKKVCNMAEFDNVIQFYFNCSSLLL